MKLRYYNTPPHSDVCGSDRKLPHAARVGRRWLAVLIAVAALLTTVSRAWADKEYSFAVVPHFEQRKLFAIWKPIVDELQRRTQLRLKLVATLSIGEFEGALASGKFDFVYTNPYQIMRESSRQGYIPLVRDETSLRGVLVVAKDSPIEKIADLDGKVFAVPSPNAMGASLLIQADLLRSYGMKMRLKSVKSHSSVYLHVVNRLVDAGGGVDKTLSEQPLEIRNALRVLYSTRTFPSHPISAHPRIPADERDKVRAALLEMGTTPEGGSLLAKVPIARVVPASIEIYRSMADWGLEAFWIEGDQ